MTLDEPLTVMGSGFRPGEPVAILLVIDQNLQPLVGGGTEAQATASSAGTFSADFDSIGGEFQSATRDRALGDGGMKSIEAQGADGSRASVPVTIVSAPGGPPSPSTSLAVAPVEPGGDAIIQGAGFHPNEFVTILVVGASAGQDRILVGGEANEFGAFSMEATVDLEENIYTLKAVGDRGSEATAPLIVAMK